MRTVFIVSDCRESKSPKEIGYISYSKHVLPREIKAAIRSPALPEEPVYTFLTLEDRD
jgi:hypothetical protein